MTHTQRIDHLVYDVVSLEVSLGGRTVLGPLCLEVAPGSFLGVVGPNGSGKTTLLRALAGTVQPSAGAVRLLDRLVAHYRPAELARLIGVVPQSFNLDFTFTVEEMVSMGRHAHRARGIPDPQVLPGARAAAQRRAADGKAVAAALEATGMSALSDRAVTQLSGGERQRALIAQTLAQETLMLLLDEPLNNLDLNHQLEIMQLLRSLHAAGRTIIVVLHDLNMAAQYCDELLLLEAGRPAALGTPGDVLDPRLILEVFKARVSVHRQGRRPYMTPVWSDPVAVPSDRAHRRVHVVAGGGAATSLIEELVLRGFTPSVGIVSVFDTDYATAQSYELEVVSTPPFEPYSEEALMESGKLVDQADVIIVAPVFFGRGNLAALRGAMEAAKMGTKVILIGEPPIADRDLSDGQATALVAGLLAVGALEVGSAAQAVECI